jgi:hypothetical protein
MHNYLEFGKIGALDTHIDIYRECGISNREIEKAVIKSDLIYRSTLSFKTKK